MPKVISKRKGEIMLIAIPEWQTKMEKEIKDKIKSELWGIVGDYNLNSNVFSDSKAIKEAIEEIVSVLIMIKKNAKPEHTKEELKQFKELKEAIK